MSMNGDVSEKSFAWLTAPVVFVAAYACFFAVWALVEPDRLVRLFDDGGLSPVEIAALPLFAAIVPLVWWKCPFEGSVSRKRTLSLMVSLVALMAIVKELDLHNEILSWIYPEYVGDDGSLIRGKLVRPDGRPIGGTPFKMRVITNAGAPFFMKALIVAYFALFFGVFAAGFAYLFPSWIKGVFRLDPAAWAIGCFGASGVVVQLFDRLPSWLKNTSFSLEQASKDGGVGGARSLCTALEEGGEILIALFALMAIYLANRSLSCKDR